MVKVAGILWRKAHLVIERQKAAAKLAAIDMLAHITFVWHGLKGFGLLLAGCNQAPRPSSAEEGLKGV
jgi:hypothetical protein